MMDVRWVSQAPAVRMKHIPALTRLPGNHLQLGHGIWVSGYAIYLNRKQDALDCRSAKASLPWQRVHSE